MFKNHLRANFGQIETTGAKVSLGLKPPEKMAHIIYIDGFSIQLLVVAKLDPELDFIHINMKTRNIEKKTIEIVCLPPMSMSMYIKSKETIFQNILYSARNSFGISKWRDIDCLGKSEQDIFDWFSENVSHFKLVKTVMIF